MTHCEMEESWCGQGFYWVIKPTWHMDSCPVLDEVLDHTVRLYAAAIGPAFVLIDNNAQPYRAVLI